MFQFLKHILGGKKIKEIGLPELSQTKESPEMLCCQDFVFCDAFSPS